ncbi:hypothetical protein EG329_002800 [Mollisiaceae sp. DMI_Dod_QoI]|nr:hypothetical protein EG329_002800 [Helotiales sp. DMI_Dod_QoI]
MASNVVPFRLKSYQTALAIVAPSHLHSDINSLRKIHDKAYERWDPHLNVLYPFVDPNQLGDAIAILRERLAKHDVQSFEILLAGADKFMQRRGATVHLKPDIESEERISQLRADLVDTLGRDAGEGTHDGTFRPHMTIGQAGIMGPTLGMLIEKVTKLAPLRWQCRSLAVLKRELSGKMVLVDEIWFSGEGKVQPDENEGEQVSAQHWKMCNAYTSSDGWRQLAEHFISRSEMNTYQSSITVSTYNLMAEQNAPAFPSRLHLIVDAIKSVTKDLSYPRVLCLQEVSDEMLPILLTHPIINNLYPFSTHQPSSLLPSQRNLVTLGSIPFKQTAIQFPERHKSALVVDLLCMSVKIVNTHLSRSLSDDAVATKKSQMDLLTKFCLSQSAVEVVVAGDFNLTTSSHTIEAALTQDLISLKTAQLIKTVITPEIWEDSFLALQNTSKNGFDGEGATFDRIGNPLAAISIGPIDDRPQRYDRVLYRKNGTFKVEHIQLFGLPDGMGHCGSDHYGFAATLCIGEARAPPHEEPAHPPESAREMIVVKEDSTDLARLLRPWLPSEEDRVQRRDAIQLVQGVLSSSNSLSNLVLAPLGSYLMDTYFPDSDVDLLAIGSVAPPIFFEYASSRFQHLDAERSDGVKGVHLVNSLVSIMEMSVLDIKFDLQYCQAPVLLERYHTPGKGTPLNELAFDATLIFSLPPSSLRPFNTYRDTAYILNATADNNSYQIAHRFLSLYLKNRGLYSAKFGYLGGIHLSLMLNRVVKLIKLKISNIHGDRCIEISPAAIVRTFFSYYSTFSWATESVSDPDLLSKNQAARTPRDAVFIPAIHVPTARPNVASSCSSLSAQTFTEQFRAACEATSRGDWDRCLRPGVTDFLSGFSAYISLSLDVWGTGEIGGTKTREIIGALESKFPKLMLAIGRLNGIYARVWPARFRTCDEGPLEGDEIQFKGQYLIGIRITNEHADADIKKVLRSKVIGAVRDFETNVKASREFENGNCWLNSEFLAGKKIRDMDLIVDKRDWSGENIVNVADHDAKADVRLSDLNLNAAAEYPRRLNTIPLRMANDVINRIKHDTKHFLADEFLIGYDDRFEEKPKEVELLKWKFEQTDEEFIPSHRVVHIRRKDENGGDVVWDRRQKLDLVFGSGKRRDVNANDRSKIK